MFGDGKGPESTVTVSISVHRGELTRLSTLGILFFPTIALFRMDSAGNFGGRRVKYARGLRYYTYAYS